MFRQIGLIWINFWNRKIHFENAICLNGKKSDFCLPVEALEEVPVEALVFQFALLIYCLTRHARNSQKKQYSEIHMENWEISFNVTNLSAVIWAKSISRRLYLFHIHYKKS